jgi:two-component system, LuxR family, response regulator FixJ
MYAAESYQPNRRRYPMDATLSDTLVYVLDDDASVRQSLERLMRSVGLEVRSFPSAAEFLSCGLEDRPCCLVVDVRMPGISGLDLQESLSASGWTAPIIFITGHGTVPMSVRAMRAGAVNFLQKPFEEQEILDSIHQAVERETRAFRERARRLKIERQLEALTPREHEVFSLVVAGLPNKRIAGRLGTSEKTIKVHRARVMEKMHAESLAALVRMAYEAEPEPVPPEKTEAVSVRTPRGMRAPVGPRSNTSPAAQLQ